MTFLSDERKREIQEACTKGCGCLISFSDVPGYGGQYCNERVKCDRCTELLSLLEEVREFQRAGAKTFGDLVVADAKLRDCEAENTHLRRDLEELKAFAEEVAEHAHEYDAHALMNRARDVLRRKK